MLGVREIRAGPLSTARAIRDCRSWAREFLRKADPMLARTIDARSDFRPRARLAAAAKAAGSGDRRHRWRLAR
jgi:hypothetical protein